MNNWTKEQLDAINKEGTNLIVSAGAGSGKTAVLTERVIRKLKDGVSIDKLLVLTFTHEAANEMKTRIRKAIKKEETLKKELDYLDSAYITTFDSYAFSVVRKYNYLINSSKNISIVDSSIIEMKKKEIIDSIFDTLYEKEDKKFLKLIKDFCLKDDDEIKKYILKISSKLDLKYDKKTYLDNYIKDYYNKEYIEKIVNEYKSFINNDLNNIKDLYNKILSMESDKNIKKYDSLIPLINATSYDEIRNNLDISAIRNVEYKDEKDLIMEYVNELKKLTIYEKCEDIKYFYEETKDYVSIIIDIIKELDSKLYSYKKKNDSYEFIDISKMAIDIVKNNESVQNEIKNYYNEIMVDEYQDTNDLQEMFISLIGNNNIYMVGDIKQSIYRFRNANPDIFKDKYDRYSNLDGGEKIDLLKNFRSREEVLDDINKIFSKIMDDNIGGADYASTHKMAFGFLTYKLKKMFKHDNYLEVKNYDDKDKKEFTCDEKEAFIIAKDIKEKMKSYEIVDKKTGELKKVSYKDFCIIMDRGTYFDTYKKVFEYFNIPLTVYKDEKLNTENDTFIIKNLISLIIKIKENKLDGEFKYYFTSIARSYLFSMEDEEIFNVFINDKFKETDIYKIAKEISLVLDEVSCHKFLNLIINKFNVYEKILSYHDVDGIISRINYLEKLSKNLEVLGYTPYDFKNYLTVIIESENEVRYKARKDDSDSVKIMNIHQSKGLEFPICYYSGFYAKFMLSDMNDRFIYDNKYGIITPYFNMGIGEVFTKHLARDKYIKDEISEKIRLLYVALTRAKEKMIVVAPLDDNIYNEEGIIKDRTRLKYRSFLGIFNTVKDMFDKSTKSIDLEKLGLDKTYKKYIIKDLDIFKTSKEKINHKKLNIDNGLIEEKHFSKINNKLKTEEELENMKYGTKMHYLYETLEFKKGINPYIDKLLNHDIFSNIDKGLIYKEYEFIEEDESDTYHGVIDLMVCYDDYIDIVDYKLKNVLDDAYKVQLGGYKKYIENKTGKRVNTYLYSIEEDILLEIK